MAKSSSRRVAERAATKLSRYQRVFSGPDGRAVLYDLMQVAEMLTMNPDADTNQTFIREGKRQVVLRILAYLKADPKQLLERIEEHEDEMAE